MAKNKPTGKLNDEDAFSKWLDTPAPKKPKSREEVKRKMAQQVSETKRAQATAKRVKTRTERLTPRERRFCQLYVETNKAAQSVVDAGYNVSNLNSAGTLASDLLRKPTIQQEIQRLQQPGEDKAIATAQEVMQRLTAIARGEDKDQFGLDISASDRLKALVELAKRTIDIEQRIAGKPDATVEIKLDWDRDS